MPGGLSVASRRIVGSSPAIAERSAALDRSCKHCSPPESGPQTCLQVSRRGCARAMLAFSPPCKAKGAGDAGCSMHPQPDARSGVTKYAHQYSQRKHRKHPASPTQWFTDYTRSSRGPLAVLTPSVRKCRASQPGWAPRDSIRTLTPTMGRQNHATSPSATPPLVSHAALAHELSSPCDHLSHTTASRPPHPAPRS